MTRGNKKRAGAKRNSAGLTDLARMLREMGIGVRGNNAMTELPEYIDSELLDEWHDAISGLISSHSVDIRRRGERVRGSLELKSVDREKGCEVVLKCGASTYRASWEFDLDGRTFATSCNCGHKDLCEHTYFMAMRISQLLNNPRSELVTKIVGEDLEERNLNETFSMLQSLARNAQLAAPKIDDAPAIDKPLSRFVWDVRFDRYYKTAQVCPCVQQEKKNGGWTKGKETTLDAFLKSSREEWTAVDRQLAELIRQERWQTLTLELADALRVLAGSDQFTLDREPCELEARPLEIVVRQADIIPLDKKEALLKELEPLRSCMAVRLPESVAGQEVKYKGQMTLVLQLRRNGMLDASIQVRDRNQMLQSPGEGLIRIHETIDGKPVQYVRDLSDEVHGARDLATELKLKRGVPISRCGWRISDADDISNLLSDAGAAVERGELVVLWHKDSVSRFDVIGRLTANNVRVTVSRQRDWFGLTGTCKIGEQEIPAQRSAGRNAWTTHEWTHGNLAWQMGGRCRRTAKRAAAFVGCQPGNSRKAATGCVGRAGGFRFGSGPHSGRIR
jgi:hypothetical protein